MVEKKIKIMQVVFDLQMNVRKSAEKKSTYE